MQRRATGNDDPLGWTLDGLRSWASAHGEPEWRGDQIARWLFGRRETVPARMDNLPASLRDALAEEAPPSPPAELIRRESADGTVKWLLGLADGESVETVLIPEGNRTTLCVSTQVGCPIGCRFCRTGEGGLVRSLSAAEIVGQIVVALRSLGEGKRLTNIVVMGMGEPLLNAAAVARSLLVATARWGFAMAPARITVSTAGVLPALEGFRRLHPAVNLAVSLNAPNQPLRDELMPGARGWPLSRLIPALASLPGRARHPVTLEYVLLGGVNDGPPLAGELAAIAAPARFLVNLIPWNPVAGGGFSPPEPQAVEAFAGVLAGAGVRVTVRRGRGADIEAACGQLRAEARR